MKTLNNDKTLFCNENIDPNIGAPILSEFYIMSANNVCAITNQHNSYMSDRMIDILLTIFNIYLYCRYIIKYNMKNFQNM
jgi:hypothetical protein